MNELFFFIPYNFFGNNFCEKPDNNELIKKGTTYFIFPFEFEAILVNFCTYINNRMNRSTD